MSRTESEPVEVTAGCIVLDIEGAEYDVLLSRMQTPKARKAMDSAFNASPAELGKAAVKAARKKARS